MAVNILTATATTLGQADAVRILVNAAMTGTITTTAAGSTQYGTPASTLGVITNPAAGQTYTYRRLRGAGAITITTSATCDLSAAKLGPLEA